MDRGAGVHDAGAALRPLPQRCGAVLGAERGAWLVRRFSCTWLSDGYRAAACGRAWRTPTADHDSVEFCIMDGQCGVYVPHYARMESAPGLARGAGVCVLP